MYRNQFLDSALNDSVLGRFGDPTGQVGGILNQAYRFQPIAGTPTARSILGGEAPEDVIPEEIIPSDEGGMSPGDSPSGPALGTTGSMLGDLGMALAHGFAYGLPMSPMTMPMAVANTLMGKTPRAISLMESLVGPVSQNSFGVGNIGVGPSGFGYGGVVGGISPGFGFGMNSPGLAMGVDGFSQGVADGIAAAAGLGGVGGASSGSSASSDGSSDGTGAGSGGGGAAAGSGGGADGSGGG